MRSTTHTSLPMITRAGAVSALRRRGAIGDLLLETLHYLPKPPALRPVEIDLPKPSHVVRGAGFPTGSGVNFSNAWGLNRTRDFFAEMDLLDKRREGEPWPATITPEAYISALMAAEVDDKQALREEAAVRQAMSDLVEHGVPEP